jgi:hypothetical protein
VKRINRRQCQFIHVIYLNEMSKMTDYEEIKEILDTQQRTISHLISIVQSQSRINNKIAERMAALEHCVSCTKHNVSKDPKVAVKYTQMYG